MNQDPGRDTAFYLRKVSDCIRYAEEAAHPGLRAYWLELAHRWMQSITPDAPPDMPSNRALDEPMPVTASKEKSSAPEGSSNDVILPPWSEEQIAALDELPPSVRALAFQELASQATHSAALTDGEQRQAFINSAVFWQRLANMAEQEVK